MLGSVSSRVILAMVLVGVLLSVWHVSIAEMVNRDGAAYLLAASGDWSQGLRVTRWPFYPLMLQWLSGVFQTDAETIAYSSNVVFDAVTLYFFLRIVRLFGGTRLTLFWAGLAFLALAYFNDNRAEIIRDHGYWAAFMVALWYYIRLFRVFSWGRVTGWTVAILVASLFRIEGLVFLALSPLGLLLNRGITWRQRWIAMAKIWLPTLVLAMAALAALLVTRQWEPVWHVVLHNIDYFVLVVTTVIPGKAAMLHTTLPMFSGSEVLQGFYIVLAWAIANDFINALTPFFFLVLLFRWWFPVEHMSSDTVRIVGTFVLVNLLLLMFWVILHRIMVARYTMIVAFLALIWVAFALASLHQRYRSSTKGEPVRVQFAIVVLVLAAMLADGVIESGSSKGYVRDAGQWIQQHVPQNSSIATNYEPERLRYYANKGLGSTSNYDLNTAISTKPVDFLLVRLRKHELTDIDDLGLQISAMRQIHVISNDSGGGYAIYQR